MDSSENLKFIELIPYKFLAVGWNTFCFCVELLLYLKILNNILTLQAPGQGLSSKMIFLVSLDKIFQPKRFWLDAEVITASGNWKGLF